ncbi:TolC family protein [Planctomicrobium sp. SH661]|uniref:TolC family protein n=1 Tax=Planctomicrobium sp. SH661 TaxID=3448124 RepID=UPI003F5BD069
MRRGNRERFRKFTAITALAGTLVSGCVRDRSDVTYLGKEKRELYRSHAMDVAFPNVDEPLPSEVTGTEPPHTILETDEIPIREISLAETIQVGLQNSQVIRTAGAFLTNGNPLLASPQFVPSVYDPAIQASGVLFGSRGVEAALSAFDAQLASSMVWGRNSTTQNSTIGLNPFTVINNETGAFNATLSKTMANGGQISVYENVNYLGTSSPIVNYPSSYAGATGINYTLPLLAGAGTEFTRIAGPIGQQFGGLTGVSQGVLISRINEDITISEFETNLQILVRDIEDSYWNLYQAYRAYHTAVTAKESSLLTWRIADLQLQGGVRTRAEVAQARDQYFATDAASINARSNIFTTEIRLRRLIGLPANDGTTLRPLDEPVTAQLIPDWYTCLTDSLTRRVELRTQKWNLKSMELQLEAAKSLVKPQLNFVSGYQVNGFGNDLIGYNQTVPTGNFYENMTAGNQTGWNLGFNFNWAIGFRAAMSQVRNYELRVAKAQRVLAEQEKEITHELAVSFQEVSRAYAAAETNMNRMIAARENVKYLEPNIREGTILLDELLRAQLRQAEAEVAYYQSLVQYNQALNDMEYRKGTILTHNSIYMSEGPWNPEAYRDAKHNADARNHAIDGSGVLESVPEPFASPSPVGGVYYTAPQAMPGAVPTPAESSNSTQSSPIPKLEEPLPALTEPVDTP